jgi:flavin-binding protein dodecin
MITRRAPRGHRDKHPEKDGSPMGNSVYKVIEIVGTSETSWEDATAAAVATAAKTLRDLRVAEVVKQDVTINDDGTVDQYRTRLSVSFKYQDD